MIWHNQDPTKSWNSRYADALARDAFKHQDTEIGQANARKILEIAFQLQETPQAARGPRFGIQHLNQACTYDYTDKCVEKTIVH